MWKDTVTLRMELTALDEYKRPYKTFTDKVVQAKKKSVKYNEFYQAQATGLKPEAIFEVRLYEGQSHLIYNGVQYRVIRSYERHSSFELTCTSLLNESEYS